MTFQDPADEPTGAPTPGPRPAQRSKLVGRKPQGWERYLGEPRNAVLFVLTAVIVGGGGRRLWKSWQARKAVTVLEGGDVTAEAIAGSVAHGRAGLFELFRLLGEARTETLRHAAGRAIAALWARDELIAEEEKALVRRGFRADWRARKRYPRGLRAEIPVTIAYGLPFLDGSSGGVVPGQLEWSHRVVGARRANLEAWSPWVAGAGRAEFAVVPSDFEADGPHRLVLQPRVRTAGLTESWELELPHMPFSFEFDPLLHLNALLALPESTRAEEVGRRVRLVPAENAEAPAFLDLHGAFALRNPPEIEVTPPLPCDLAHAVSVEFEGVVGRFPAGSVVLAGQGTSATEPGQGGPRRFRLGGAVAVPPDAVDRPGARRLRAVLTPDPEIGWGDPDVRSLWPEPVATDWVEVDVVRR